MPDLMKNSIILLLLILSSPGSYAQFSDNFEDGDLTNGNSWTGDIQKFKVNTDYQLQLYTTGEGVSYISSPLQTNGIVEWNIWVKLSFSPSDNNHTLIYLLSDCEDLMSPLNGYYLKLGETGSGDAIELYRQVQSEHILITRGHEGFLKDPFTLRIKVVRDDGHWQVFADSTGGSDFSQQAYGNDEYWQQYDYFGIVCKYTSSNSTKFRFDDIYAGPLIIDSTPPELLEAVVAGASSIDLYFNEPLKSQQCAQLSNYQVDEDIGFPIAAGRDVSNPFLVRLQFLDQFIEGKDYELTISNLQDETGNTILLKKVRIFYYPVKPFQIVINEIMADPAPVIGLPDCEYIELYNTANHKVRIEGWKLITGESVKTMPMFIIEPHSYHLLSGTGNDSLLTNYGPVTCIPGFALLNTGTSISLKNNTDELIHEVTYDPAWYKNELKESGGWSLEMIDPKNPCGADGNWSGSIDQTGGTPGRKNSVNDLNPDLTTPEIAWLCVPDSVSIKVVFNEVMDSLTMANPFNYHVDHGIGYPESVSLDPTVYNSITLYYNAEFFKDTVYCLTISRGITDCAGNEIKNVTNLLFGNPYTSDSNDLVINEVLFDPKATGTEFIEIYNRSSKVISLKDLHIALKEPVTGNITNPGNISKDGRMVFPGEYLVLTNEPALVRADYFTPDPGNFLDCDEMPSLSNSGATIVITTRKGEIIDEFSYSDDMHFALLNSTKGVSLERVDYNRSAKESGNWHSAASSVGYATPAYRNSQYMQGSDGNEVTIEPVTFSPDNDGFNDQLLISCNFRNPGNLVSIKIYDDEGRFIRQLTGNFLAGESCNFNWDGTNDNKQKVPSGIYIVYTRIVNLNGTVSQSKNGVVVAGY